jgi:Retroviral aspartyl protease
MVHWSCIPSTSRWTKNSDMQLDLKGTLIHMDIGESIQATGLLDSGATESTIDKSFIERYKIPKQWRMDYIPLTNTDRTLNIHGPITHNVVLLLQIGDHTKHRSFGITALEGHDFCLGCDWLQEHNSNINWITYSITVTKRHFIHFSFSHHAIILPYLFIILSSHGRSHRSHWSLNQSCDQSPDQSYDQSHVDCALLWAWQPIMLWVIQLFQLY